MRFDLILIGFIILVFIVSLVRAFWPLIVIYLIYVLIRSLFFDHKNNRPSSGGSTSQNYTTNANKRDDRDYIEAEFETREVDDE